MTKNHRWLAEVDEYGRLVLPPKLAEKFGIQPGDSLLVQEDHRFLSLSRPLNAIARVNIEVTNICNLSCRTCMRNTWSEPEGQMRMETFERILAGIKRMSPKPMVFFGGFGEPLSHPNIIEMLSAVKQTGARLEMITNGTLLNEETARALVGIRLDRLWVSLDGASPDCYADVRLGAALPQVLDNMKTLSALRTQMQSNLPQIGIAFVAMRRNIGDLPQLIRLSVQFGAKSISVSNVLAHTPELQKEMLYLRSMYDVDSLQNEVFPTVELPRLDINGITLPVIDEILKASYTNNLAQFQSSHRLDICPFLADGSTSIRWDGQVSPCLPLLHTHHAYLDDRQRLSREYSVGSIRENDLLEIWNSDEYRTFRRKLQTFDFSPCVICNSCEMANDNQEDCFGNAFPTCGGCLWAQGIIQCP